MAAIRIPSNAIELLPYCQRSEHAREDACFDTFAHLIVTAACLGYRLEDGSPRACESFLKTPAAIDLGVFRSQRLFNQMLILSMMIQTDNEKALDETNICKAVEDFAHAGLERMASELSEVGEAGFPEQMARWIAEPPALQI